MPRNYRRWLTDVDADTASSALNAALLGITAEASIDVEFQGLLENHEAAWPVLHDSASVSSGTVLNYLISLPDHDPAQSGYKWSLTVYRPHDRSGDEEIVSGHEGGVVTAEKDKIPTPKDYDLKTILPSISRNEKAGKIIVRGAISLNRNHSIHALRLSIDYWPNKRDSSCRASLIVIEDKMDRMSNK